jgi:hypothetical protein
VSEVISQVCQPEILKQMIPFDQPSACSIHHKNSAEIAVGTIDGNVEAADGELALIASASTLSSSSRLHLVISVRTFGHVTRLYSTL